MKPVDPIFVGGAPRSGTTLIRAILDSHPNIACGPELRVSSTIARLWSQTNTHIGPTLRSAYHLSEEGLKLRFSGFLASFLEEAHKASGKRRIAEKTPANVLQFSQLHQLFPQSPLIHIVRDGRDVISSLQTMDWRDRRTGLPFDYVTDPRAAARLWVDSVTSGREMKDVASADGLYFEIFYEELIEHPREVLQGLFDFLGEPWANDVMHFHANPRNTAGMNESSAAQITSPLYTSSVGRWLDALDEDMLPEVMAILTPALDRLGYNTGTNW